MASNRKTAIQKREDVADDTVTYIHQPVTSNALKIKLDHLKTFEALTTNQQKFFDAYKRGDYFMGLLGSPGVGKTFLALYRAIEEVLDRSNPFEHVVVVRSAVQVRDKVMFLVLWKKRWRFMRCLTKKFVRHFSVVRMRGTD